MPLTHEQKIAQAEANFKELDREADRAEKMAREAEEAAEEAREEADEAEAHLNALKTGKPQLTQDDLDHQHLQELCARATGFLTVGMKSQAAELAADAERFFATLAELEKDTDQATRSGRRSAIWAIHDLHAKLKHLAV